MAYTFGGATTDSVLWTGQNSMGNAGTGLVMGWWKPSTLTATRRLWSSGTVTGCAIDTTTSELRVVAAGTVTTTATAAFTEQADGIVAAGDIVTEAAVQTAAVRHAYEIDNRTTAVVSNARTYEFGD